MTTAMRLLSFKIGAILFLASSMAKAQTVVDVDSSVVTPECTVHMEQQQPLPTRYDRRVHHYRRSWSALLPTQSVLQTFGNMGLFSLGVGWDYGKRGQWETQLLFGLIPKFDSSHAKVTMTLKENYIPWSTNLGKGWAFEPLECGLYFTTVFGKDFWTKQPSKYGSGYYPFSTRIRPNIFLGERFTKEIPSNKRKFVKSLTFFYELSTCDIYFMRFYRNGSAGFWDVFGLSLGVKSQIF